MTRQVKYLPLALIFAVHLCGIWSCGSGGGVAGSDSFTVTSISPMDGATGVGLEINIEIYFSKEADPNTVNIVNIAVGDNPVDVAVDATYVWVLGVDDPLSGGFTTRITRSDTSQQTDFPAGGAPSAFAVDDDSVWIVSAVPALITRIIKATQVVTAMTLYEIPLEIAVDDTHIWLTNLNSDTVTRFTKSNVSEQTTINVGDGPSGDRRRSCLYKQGRCRWLLL